MGFKHDILGVFDQLFCVVSQFEDDFRLYSELLETWKIYIKHPCRL